jgi:hypothetical protein
MIQNYVHAWNTFAVTAVAMTTIVSQHAASRLIDASIVPKVLQFQ